MFYLCIDLRFELIENGKTTRFVYHDGELLHEKGEDGEEREISYHLGAGIDAFRRDGKSYYYHQDEQLSTAFITDHFAEIQNSYQYDAFGNELNSVEPLSNRIRYTGQQYDDLTEQYYLRARFYNPALGRFMQEDVYQGDGLNLYAYCGNNPVMYSDPSGYATNPPQPNNTCVNTSGEIGNGTEDENSVVKNLDETIVSGDGVQDDEVRWNNGWRTKDGKYASPQDGQLSGAWAEQAVWDAVKQIDECELTEGRIYTRDSQGRERVYDGFVEYTTPEKTYNIGLEIKSENASYYGRQREIESGISVDTPAIGIGKNANIEVDYVVVIRVKKNE